MGDKPSAINNPAAKENKTKTDDIGEREKNACISLRVKRDWDLMKGLTFSGSKQLVFYNSMSILGMCIYSGGERVGD